MLCPLELLVDLLDLLLDEGVLDGLSTVLEEVVVGDRLIQAVDVFPKSVLALEQLAGYFGESPRGKLLLQVPDLRKKVSNQC